MKNLLRRLLLSASVLVSLSAAADCVYTTWTPVSTLDREAAGVHAFDVNGDSRPDIVGHTDDGIFLALNDGAGAFAASNDIYTGTILGPLVTGDFTGDGKRDLAFGTNGSLVVLPGMGDGTFGSAITTAITITPTNALAATVDAGATLDLLVLDAILKVLVRYTNDGTGQFFEASRTTTGLDPNPFVAADFDADGVTDSIVGYPGSTYDAFWGASGGTFGSAAGVAGRSGTRALHAADLTADGLPELLTGNPDEVSVLHNLGSRSFAAPDVDSVSSGPFSRDLGTGEFTGDAHRDVAWVGACGYGVVRGTGTATLGHGIFFSWNFPGCTTFTTGDLDSADFDGDGRRDLVLAGSYGATNILRTYRNRCGDLQVLARAEPRVVTTGNSTQVIANIGAGAPIVFAPTGEVTVVENGQTLATGSFQSLQATFTLTLPLGVHELVVKYAGDEHYEPTESEPFTATVTNETTTTTLTINPAATVYGHTPSIGAAVTASNGQTPTGRIRISIDGTPVVTADGPSITVPSGSVPASIGTHDVTANFLGDAAQPPSSASGSYYIVKQTPQLSAATAGGTAGQSGSITLALQWTGTGSVPTGVLALSEEGGFTFDEEPVPGNGAAVQLTVPALNPGTYSFRATYSGDSKYNPVATTVYYTVLAAETINARGTASAVTVTWNSTKTIVARRVPGGIWVPQGSPAQQPWTDTSASPSTVYLYRMEGQDGATLADVAQRVSFTDDPLQPGMPVKALHLQEIVAAANAIRAAAGLELLTLTFQPGEPIAAEKIVALRTGIAEGRAAAGAYAYPFAGIIQPGSPIVASGIQDLREAVR